MRKTPVKSVKGHDEVTPVVLGPVQRGIGFRHKAERFVIVTRHKGSDTEADRDMPAHI